METYDVELKLESYISNPYWPVLNTCIDIEKKSGCNRCKSEDKRVAALKAECDKRGLTYEKYLAMREEAKNEWQKNAEGFIVIPRHQLAGALVETVSSSPKSLRGPFDRDNFRACVIIGDFVTELKGASGVFSRFVKLKDSNQRNWQENEFVGRSRHDGKGVDPFTAVGKISVDDPKEAKTVYALLRQAVGKTGIGSSRPMGFGRGEVVKFGEWPEKT